MNNSHDRLELGEESVPPDEEAAIKAVLKLSQEVLLTSDKPNLRAQHAKHHGCVEAEFIVEPNLPDHLQHGIFSTPGTYQALVRFSNGGRWDDRDGDAHGMAVKLLGVEGNQISPGQEHKGIQDFVMVDHSVFFIRNASDFVEFTRAFRDAKLSRLVRSLGFLLKVKEAIFKLQLFVRFLKNHTHEKEILTEFAGKKPLSPLQIQYWSTTPYSLGPHAIRFTARPDLTGVPAPATADSPDRLRKAMSAHLEEREACFDFLVQRQTDAVKMPVEDPTIQWDEADSPSQKVARIRIPAQAFESDEQMTKCEDLSFSPWHSLPDHKPLGGINRVRKVVYEEMSRNRLS